MAGSGGYRAGAGRKRKEEFELVRNQSTTAIIKVYGSLEKGFEALLKSNEPSLIKFVWEHSIGKPVENIDVLSAGDKLSSINLTVFHKPTNGMEIK